VAFEKKGAQKLRARDCTRGVGDAERVPSASKGPGLRYWVPDDGTRGGRNASAEIERVSSKQRSADMAKYVDGYVLPVPKENVEAYRRMADEAGKVWREHGALEYVECIAEDVKPGETTSFPQAVKLEPNETVVFAWVVFESREHRDQVNAKVMQDPRIAGFDPKMLPFDGKRMIYGGFATLVSH
jgi:uncharacterized protein YbaA (DUF1428 family)